MRRAAIRVTAETRVGKCTRCDCHNYFSQPERAGRTRLFCCKNHKDHYGRVKAREKKRTDTDAAGLLAGGEQVGSDASASSEHS